jgi:hypothetical protein
MRHAFAGLPNEGGLPWQRTTRTSTAPIPRARRDPARVEAVAVAVREVPADRAAVLVAPAAAAPVAEPAEAAAEVAVASVDPVAAAAAEGLEEALIRGAAPVVVAMVEAVMQEAAAPVVDWVVAAVDPRAVRVVRAAWGIRAVDLPVATSVGQAGPAAPVDAGPEVQADRTSRSSLQEQKGAEKQVSPPFCISRALHD